VAEARRFFRALAAPTKGTRRAARGGSARGWQIIGGGWEALAPGGYALRRDFPYFEIEYIDGGRGQIELAGRCEGLAPGTIFAIAPDTRRGRRADPRRPPRRYYLWLEGAGADAALRAAGLLDGCVSLVETPGEIRENFEWILREGGREHRESEAILQHLARILLLKLSASVRARSPASPCAKGDDGESARQNFERCLALVDNEAEHLRNTGDIAAAAGLRSETVCRLFRRFHSSSPGAHLRTRRMRLAAERLHLPGARVKEVAASLGFTDAFHFSRVFHAELGLSPRAWKSRASAVTPAS